MGYATSPNPGGEGVCLGRGYPLSTPHSPRRLRRLDCHAFGATDFAHPTYFPGLSSAPAP